MNKNKWIAVLLSALMLLSLTACGGKGGEELAPSDYLPDITPPLDVAITDCLSADEASTVIGVPMTASDPYEDGTWVIYSSEDGLRSISVSMENATIGVYDAMIAELSGGEAQTTLGHRAYWYSLSGEMINFCEGYSIAVSVNDPTVASTRGLCEAVMKTIVDNLQAM